MTHDPDHFELSLRKTNMEQAFATKLIREAESRLGPPITWRYTPLARLPDDI